MLEYEQFEKNGAKYTRAYSDSGMYIEFPIDHKPVLLKEAIFRSELNLCFIQSRTPIANLESSIYINRNELKDRLSYLSLANKMETNAKQCQTEAESRAYLAGFRAAKEEFLKMLGGEDNGN